MKWTLFLQILKSFCARDSYFLQKWDAFGNIGLSSIQKCIIKLHILAYRITPNAIDEYYQMGENVKMEAMKCFVKATKEIFKTKYSR